MEKEYRFKFLSDPGHGWLEVPRKLVNELGIGQQITSFSYQREDTVYLEEDCDASLFANTCKAKGIKLTFDEKYYDPIFVRNLPCYDKKVAAHA